MQNDGTRSINDKEGQICSAQTLEHGVADVIMRADVVPGISYGIEEPVRRGEARRDAEEIRGGRGKAANGSLVVHEELEKIQKKKRWMNRKVTP